MEFRKLGQLSKGRLDMSKIQNILNTGSNTLVIHPKDATTDCLSVIYEGRGWDVIRDYDTPREKVMEEIKKHDRIIMLGHGTSWGLLAGTMVEWPRGRKHFQRFSHYIVDFEHAELLQGKDTFSIWCNSDQFFKKYGLKGLHTGMIISEIGEEWVLPGAAEDEEWTPPLTEKEMAKNMELFCGAFAKYIDLTPEECQKKVLEKYVGDDEVTKFNRERILIL